MASLIKVRDKNGNIIDIPILQGPKGPAGKITNITASVSNTTGTPNVAVTLGGTAEERTIDLAFSGLKGEKGEGAVTSVNGKIGAVTLNASDVGALPNTTSIPSNLSDLSQNANYRTVTDTEKATWNAKSTFSGSYNDLTNKPTIPAAVTVDSALSSSSTNPVQNKVVNSALGNKVDVVSGKGLSTNDFTTAYKNKLDGIATGATANTGTITGVTAGTGLSGGGTSGAVTLSHSNSITAGSVGAAASPANGGTFSIPKITYDSQGHITQATTATITLPSISASDTQVTQTVRTTNGSFPLLLRGTSAGTTTTTTTTTFGTKITANPSTGVISATGFSGSGASLTSLAPANIAAGTLGGKVQANATAAATLADAQVRDIIISTTDLTADTSALATGTVYLVYE